MTVATSRTSRQRWRAQGAYFLPSLVLTSCNGFVRSRPRGRGAPPPPRGLRRPAAIEFLDDSGRLVVHSATGCRAQPTRALPALGAAAAYSRTVTIRACAAASQAGRVPCSAYWPRRKVSVSRATCGCFSAGRSRSRMASAFWAASTSPGAAHPRGVARIRTPASGASPGAVAQRR